MTRACLALAAILASTVPVAAQPPLDGTSAPRWSPCPGWVSGALPAQYSVANQQGALLFTAEGPAGTQMPWVIALRDDEMGGDARYCLVHYRAEGLAAPAGNYFLHGYEGTPGGITFAFSDEVEPDGAWHTMAVDLAKLMVREPTVQVAVKVIVGATGTARLTIDKVGFGDELPAGAHVSRTAAPAGQSVVLDWSRLGELKPAPGWTTSPATDYSARWQDGAMTFTVRGAGKQMRWPLTLPQPADLGQLPFFSVRYRATGQLAPTTYAVWLGDDATGAGGHATVPLMAGDLAADGRWHQVAVRLSPPFKATQLAVGLDCAGDEATLTLDRVTFSSQPPQWPLAQVLAYEASAGPWPDGQGGFTVLTAAVTGGRPSPFLALRLGIADWFTSRSVSVEGVPFAVPDSAETTPQTGTAERGTLELPLPATAKEVYLLTAAAAPATEPWGLDSLHPRPVEVLTEPEKVVGEIRYTAGPPDFILPVEAATGGWGLRRGLGVHVFHPDPARTPRVLLLHDRMQTASFAILGAAVRTDRRVPEPTWDRLAYPTPPAEALARVRKPGRAQSLLTADFGTTTGLTWERLAVSGLPEALACAKGPLFEVSVAGRKLPDETWRVEKTEPSGAGRKFTVRQAEAGLTAVVECLPGAADSVRLRLTLRNDGTAPVTATLQFPVLRGVQLGGVADTWYLSGKRGGIINSAEVAFRDPLGEPHPLQVDGFFNPKTGLALACLTHDTVAQHHFIRLAKNAAGGEWSPEYVERDLAPGQTFTATEAELALREGDWRAIFGAYREWLKTWYRPPAAKPWWERTFAFIDGVAHYDGSPDPKVRGAIQPDIDLARKYLGLCDYVHLYGWSSSKTYGDWGDYDHYDETVGGRDYFHANIAKAQAAGVAVGLYQDGYLSCEKGQFVGAHAKEWAMKRADGSPVYTKEYDAYNQCPYIEGWQKYLAATYARIERDTGAQGLYIDEYGATDGRWLCCARDHGHNGYEIPYAGEVAMLRGIRQAVGPGVALYTEYPSAEVSRQILDGSFTYQVLWSVDQEPLAPHFVDLPRFAFPAFKQFHIIHYVTPRAGNWWPYKFPFFNGESYLLGAPNLPSYDAASMDFQRRALEVLCAHREAFASHEVEPLVRTEVAGVFVNAFRAPQETVWTVYNANGRSVHAPFLKVKHVAGATYFDAWAGKPLQPEVSQGFARLALDLGPKAIGCVLQKRP